MKHGKKYNETAKLVDRATQYEQAEAIALVKKTAVAKFDETVEIHIRTGCDGRHAEQQIRGAVVLPNGTGKTVKVLVFAKGAKAQEAQEAGAGKEAPVRSDRRHRTPQAYADRHAASDFSGSGSDAQRLYQHGF